MSINSELYLKNKRVTVLGLGTHGGGVGVVKFLVKQGARVLLSDLKKASDLPALGEVGDLPIALSLGAHRPEVFEADLIVRNPAVPHKAPVLEEAGRRGIPVVMESTLFFTFCPTNRVVGVSGTKGKTTTTLLIAEALRRAGKVAPLSCSLRSHQRGYPADAKHNSGVVAAGNFGRSMLEVLPEITPETWVVLELSSFQLEGLKSIRKSPRFAVITSFFPDHLNRYGSMDAYARAKSHLFKYQGEGDLLLMEEEAQSWFGLLGSAASVHPFKGGAREVVRQFFNLIDLPFDKTISVKPPFRLEKVGEKSGVQFINDSCATNPGATLYGLDRFEASTELSRTSKLTTGRFGENCVLITGGTDKNLDYGELSEKINELEVLVVLLSGSATEKLKRGLNRELILGETESLSKAVGIAISHLVSGGTILFSPAAASFELFDDEFDRGKEFNEAIERL